MAKEMPAQSNVAVGSVGMFTGVILLALVYLYSGEVDEHKLVLESCSRPVMELVFAVWSFAVVSFVCSCYNIDIVKVLSGQKAHSNFLFDICILAVGLTFAYLSSALFLQSTYDLTDRASEWKSFSFVAFFVGCIIMALPVPIIPLMQIRVAASRSLVRTMTAGMHTVGFADVICGDYLTSVSKGIGDLLICPCTWGESAHGSWNCITSMITPLVCALPFIWRLFQCFRCYADTSQRKHLANAFKYSLGIAVVFTSTLKRREVGFAFHAYYLFVGTNSLYSFFWDVVMDWGVWSVDVENRRLVPRGKKQFPDYFYGVAAVLDFMLRISWSLKLVNSSFQGEHSILVASALELFRRTMWACLRVEHEAYNQAKQQGKEENAQEMKKLVPAAADVVDVQPDL